MNGSDSIWEPSHHSGKPKSLIIAAKTSSQMFSFGFNEDSLDNDEVVISSSTSNLTSQQTDINPPKLISLDEILSSLKNVKLSYNCQNNVYRRELFDIKHQVMTEDNDELSNILITNESDLNKNSYEGGFKSWECSYDLIDHLDVDYEFFNKNQSILEIGSGTSLPSCHIFREKLSLNNKQSLNLVLSDFNYDVLRLVTVPNLIINWYTTKYDEEIITLSDELVGEFLSCLQEHNINLSFISGSWGKEFLSLSSTDFNLILTSETIYSLDSMPILADMLITLSSNDQTKCIVAAKDYYFGVGGSVIEFINYLKNNSKLNIQSHPVSSQLKRSIIEVSLS
ncbi:histidine protein methyltransferase 1 [[Candida] jaroonii]|uniref:Histidine protein methyltransferase 1 n=1 Tax=[Candida] jaroonii TaxID=467808 RepID=A0ACA9Y6S3_9ASCO|nr:histidine protein methyltransferase 1 [[Candida] jaroonii]